jgi:Glycosyltransferase family 87
MAVHIKRDHHAWILKNNWIAQAFPQQHISAADYVFGYLSLLVCFALFFQPDLTLIGSCSLSYLFGPPLEFYENAARAHAAMGPTACPYPPSTYAIFAAWLYPFKLLGVVGADGNFPVHLTYWLKALTTIVYFASGAIFYRIAREYLRDDAGAKYATAAWMSMPLAVFSQFIFSQMDIFYVALLLLGILMFLRGRLYLGALCFGISITFKYFPAFVFVPLLLLFEKRLSRIFLSGFIFIAPLAAIELIYRRSPAYLALVHDYVEVDRVYSVAINVGGWHVYLLFVAFMILCGVAYFTTTKEDQRLRVAAYFWLVASILPFLFVFWHPQWLIFIAPAIALTSVLSRQFQAHALLDLMGMFFFIATVSLTFRLNVDTAMFQASWLGVDLDHSFLMARLFNWFGGHSREVFLSGFWGYLILQVLLKARPLAIHSTSPLAADIDYGVIRQYLYIGLFIFILPVSVAMYKDKMNNELVLNNGDARVHFGELWSGHTFEQTFTAEGKAIKQVNLLLTTFDRHNTGDVVMEILDTDGKSVARTSERMSDLQDDAWHDFIVPFTPVIKGQTYRIRLTSPGATSGNAIGWWGSRQNSYQRGHALIDGTPEKKADFAFRVGFPR